jgi:lipopolysaccharide cholinephosphotransferase
MKGDVKMKMNSEFKRKLQMAELDILKAVVNICEENQIRYFATWGTLLGAVRHRGFIPWDDDIDIAIPRDDYERFIRIAQQKLPPHLMVHYYTTNKYAPCTVLRVMNRNTTWINKNSKKIKELYQGIIIDIEPLDGLSADTNAQKRLIKYVSLLLKLDIHWRYPISIYAHIKQRLFYPISLLLRPLFGRYLFANKIIEVLKENNYEKSKYLVFGDSGTVFRKCYFDEFIYLDFEDIKIRCPSGYHNYLRECYGDYLQIPAEDDRCEHADVIELIDFDKSYEKYTGVDNKC